MENNDGRGLHKDWWETGGDRSGPETKATNVTLEEKELEGFILFVKYGLI